MEETRGAGAMCQHVSICLTELSWDLTPEPQVFLAHQQRKLQAQLGVAPWPPQVPCTKTKTHNSPHTHRNLTRKGIKISNGNLKSLWKILLKRSKRSTIWRAAIPQPTSLFFNTSWLYQDRSECTMLIFFYLFSYIIPLPWSASWKLCKP